MPVARNSRHRRATARGAPERDPHGAHHRAGAGSGDAGDRDAGLLENLEHADVREAPRAAPAEGEHDAAGFGRGAEEGAEKSHPGHLTGSGPGREGRIRPLPDSARNSGG